VKPDLKIVVSNPPPAAAPLPLSPEQVEMPFAVVNGERITQLPRDLYIPPQALEIFLEAFEGPLDLLLYLIRRQNVDILNIPIAEITRQYTHYIELMQDLQLELAGEYLVMAATLAEIKSRMLLPRPPGEGDDSEQDPRAELVRRLQEYERFKQAAAGIDAQELYDTRPLCRALYHHILNHRELYGLPRKFNIAFDGGGRLAVLEDTNDIGFSAVKVGPGKEVPEGIYFRMMLGGLTGHRSFAADAGVLLTPDEVVAELRAKGHKL